MSKLLIGGSTAGFFSMFRGTVGTFLIAEQNELDPIVAWQGTLYNDNKFDNAWEYYFEQVSDYDMRKDRIHRCQHNILPREYNTRLEMNRLISKYVRVKSHITDRVDGIISQLGKNPLGVHVRMTDKHNCTKHGEPETGKPISIDLYQEHIDENIEENDSKIFLATDDSEVLEAMKNRYNDRIVTTDCIRSKGFKSIHHDLEGSGREKGEQVLIDCLVLSRCKHIIKGISNVALCAMFWNLDLTCENLNSIYRDDTREDFVNG
jgi:hypothetical protein